MDVSRSGQSLAEQKIAVAATRAALLKYSHGMPAVLGLLEITASLAPPILVDDIGERDTADWPEPALGVADRQQGIGVDVRRQPERGLVPGISAAMACLLNCHQIGRKPSRRFNNRASRITRRMGP